MHLEQLNLRYLADEDRILLRIGFSSHEADVAKQEIQLFFTRRILQKMWPVLMNSITSHLRINRPEAAFASSDLVNMQHRKSTGRERRTPFIIR